MLRSVLRTAHTLPSVPARRIRGRRGELMPRQRRPPLSTYALKFPKSKIRYNGTVRAFQRWRKAQRQQQELSRRINR